MSRRQIGTVSGLARYPVKSMLGEHLRELEITVGGAVGDRAYALRELVTGKIVSAKKWPAMFEFRASFESEPKAGELPAVRIILPGGRAIYAEDSNASDVLSAALGRNVKIERAKSAAADERAGINPATVFGDVPVEKVFPGLTAETMPDQFKLAAGTFFDSAVMHVVATGTLRYMATLTAGSDFDPRRFRETILVDTGDDAHGFVEDGWLEGALIVGDGVRIVKMIPALRCVMTTHPQDNLPRDLAIFRTAAFHHRANVGVFAAIESPGKVRVGDPVFLET